MTREEFDRYDIQIVRRGEPLVSRTVLRDEYIRSLEQQNAELQARIKELEEPKTCASCKYLTENLDCRIRRVCTLEDGIIGTGIIEVNETFFCLSYEPKQNHVH